MLVRLTAWVNNQELLKGDATRREVVVRLDASQWGIKVGRPQRSVSFKGEVCRRMRGEMDVM